MSSYRVRPSGHDWTFRLVDDCGQTLLKGGLHSTRGFALAAIESVREFVARAEGYSVLRTGAGRWYFCLKNAAGWQLGTSGYYASEARARGVLALCIREAVAAPVMETPMQNTASVQSECPAGAFRIDRSGNGFLLVLSDDRGATLLSVTPQPGLHMTAALTVIVRRYASHEQNYSRRLSDTGAYSYRVMLPFPSIFAVGRVYRTAEERDADMARCLVVAPAALDPVAVRQALTLQASHERRA